jgi:type I restriction enzyme M protein
MGGKKDMTDHRFLIQHGGDSEYSLITRSSDGQLMFLVNKLSKMKKGSKLGSRIAEVHNGSSLFTGDAGSGESNIRRLIIENDWLEAIVALPLNMFYNTGIATYIWVLSNRKPEHRKGKVQLIDATQWYRPLRKNLGKKNCELGPDDIGRIWETFRDFRETEQSKIFPNAAFGYHKITVERPLRLKVDLSYEKRQSFRKACEEAGEETLADMADRLAVTLGSGPHMDWNVFFSHVEADAGVNGIKLTTKHRNLYITSLASKDEGAKPVIRKTHKPGRAETDALYGRFQVGAYVVEYEPDPELRDTEQISLLEDGGIEAFFEREVLPYVPDAWIDESKTRIGYEISFTRYFYKPQKLRTLEEITADIRALEAETEGLLDQIIGETE